jgi:phosphatidylglycerophosphate synthase
MTSTAWRGPHPSSRTRLIAAGVLGTVVVVAAGVVARQVIPVGASYPWKAAGVFAAIMAVALVFLADHPFPRLGPANRVTIGRSMLIALTAAFVGEPEAPRIAAAAVVVASIAAVLDAADGWLARRSRMASAFGARFDMETDAFLVLVLSILVWRHGKAGAWILAGGLMRYAFVAARWPLPWMGARLMPTFRGKTAAVVHVIGLNVALAPVIPVPFSTLVAAATLAVLTWSFAVDIGRLWRQREVRGVRF